VGFEEEAKGGGPLEGRAGLIVIGGLVSLMLLGCSCARLNLLFPFILLSYAFHFM
jgi:hypothetical protein